MITEQAAQFYANSASNHDRIYDKPELQEELDWLRERIISVLEGHKVLELACGTGFWTRDIMYTAKSVLATDINPEMIAMAKLRALDPAIVSYRVVDAFDLPADLGDITAVFIGFWWSHIKREQQERFLGKLRAAFGKDLVLVLADDCYVEGHSNTIARTDLEGNTYQIRTAQDGQRYELVKCYNTDSYLRKKLATSAREIKLKRGDYYWLLTCRLK
jgi:SAM-dependent methyltransferase